jgi:hypothetical protein
MFVCTALTIFWTDMTAMTAVLHGCSSYWVHCSESASR